VWYYATERPVKSIDKKGKTENEESQGCFDNRHPIVRSGGFSAKHRDGGNPVSSCHRKIAPDAAYSVYFHIRVYRRHDHGEHYLEETGKITGQD
jgi:hypothetical protein